MKKKTMKAFASTNYPIVVVYSKDFKDNQKLKFSVYKCNESNATVITNDIRSAFSPISGKLMTKLSNDKEYITVAEAKKLPIIAKSGDFYIAVSEDLKNRLGKTIYSPISSEELEVEDDFEDEMEESSEDDDVIEFDDIIEESADDESDNEDDEDVDIDIDEDVDDDSDEDVDVEESDSTDVQQEEINESDDENLEDESDDVDEVDAEDEAQKTVDEIDEIVDKEREKEEDVDIEESVDENTTEDDKVDEKASVKSSKKKVKASEEKESENLNVQQQEINDKLDSETNKDLSNRTLDEGEDEAGSTMRVESSKEDDEDSRIDDEKEKAKKEKEDEESDKDDVKEKSKKQREDLESEKDDYKEELEESKCSKASDEDDEDLEVDIEESENTDVQQDEINDEEKDGDLKDFVEESDDDDVEDIDEDEIEDIVDIEESCGDEDFKEVILSSVKSNRKISYNFAKACGKPTSIDIVESGDKSYLMFDGKPVATMCEDSCSDEVKELYGKPEALLAALRAAIDEDGLTDEVNSNFGIKPIKLNIKASKVMRANLKEGYKAMASKLSESKNNYTERLTQSLSIASVGVNKGLLNTSNAFKLAFVKQLTMAGVMDAEDVVNEIFAKHGEEYLKEIIEKAKELVNSDDAERNATAKLVTTASFNKSISDKVKMSLIHKPVESKEVNASVKESTSFSGIFNNIRKF